MRRDCVQVVRRQHDRDALVVQRVQQVQDVVSRLHIDAGRRLVQQEQLRLAHERARDESPLLLPATQVPDVTVRELPDPQLVEDLPRFRARRRLSPRHQPAIGCSAEKDDFFDRVGEVPVDRFDLGYDGEANLRSVAPDADHAGGRLRRPGDQLQHRRLPRAARTDDADERPFGDRQADSVENDAFTVGVRDALELDDRMMHRG